VTRQNQTPRPQQKGRRKPFNGQRRRQDPNAMAYNIEEEEEDPFNEFNEDENF